MVNQSLEGKLTKIFIPPPIPIDVTELSLRLIDYNN